jgi:hypothetical protein
MNAIELNKIKNMLVERRQRVQQVVNIPGTKTSYVNLLQEIDSALERWTRVLMEFVWCAMNQSKTTDFL